MRTQSSDRSSVDRIVDYLYRKPEGATVVEIARDVLRISAASEKIAERLVSGILKDDPRTVRNDDGAWHYVRTKEPVESPESSFLAAVVREGNNSEGRKVPVGIAIVPIAGDKSEPPIEFEIIDKSPDELKQTADELVDRLCENVLVTLDRGKSAGAIRNFIETHSDPVFPPNLSLQRLGKSFFGLTHHPTLPEICDKLGMEVVYEGNLAAEAEVLSEVFLRLRAEGRKKGAVTLEALFEAQAFRPEKVDYSKYSFDERFLRDVPKVPGIYCMYNREGKLLYVGKTKNLHGRVNSYFKGVEDRPKKTTRLLEALYYIDYTAVGSDLEAQLLEARMIREENPEVNVQEKIHPRGIAEKTKDNLVLILPSASPDCVELFLLRKDAPLETYRLPKNPENKEEVTDLFEEFYFGEPAGDRLDSNSEADVNLARSYVAKHWDKINKVDVDTTAGAEDLLEKVMEEVYELDETNR